MSLSGLYVLTPQEPDTDALLRKVRAAIAGGATIVQYRAKDLDDARKHDQGVALLHCCRQHGVPLIVNDDVALAVAIDAEGVHLGRDDGDLAAARRALGPKKFLGASCYRDIAIAERALAAGADHVAFGSVFASPTKPGAARAPLELLTQARAKLRVPIVAIGGITAANARSVVEAGAHALAVISAVFDAPDVEAAARGFQPAFRQA
jgi:thiamine-phosphate pyrophosphorylase